MDLVLRLHQQRVKILHSAAGGWQVDKDHPVAGFWQKKYFLAQVRKRLWFLIFKLTL